MRPNPKAIKALKRVMPDIETRKAFVANCIEQNGENFEKNFNLKTYLFHSIDSENSLYFHKNSFIWFYTKEGNDFWCKIFKSLTPKERKLKLFVK